MTITDTELKQLIQHRVIADFQTEDQDFRHGLRLVLLDPETNELGLLAVEPLLRPDEEREVLTYSYQVLDGESGLPPSECLIAELKTKVEADFLPGEVPFLF